MYYDYSYLIFVLPAVILSLWASFMVKIRFSSYDKVKSQKGITGAQAAAYLLKVNGIEDVKIAHISGSLTDNYNPTTKILSLSDSTYSSSSIAAIGVAAHETGHAIQHHVGYKPLGLRKVLVPAANIGSQFGPTMVLLGLAIGAAAQSETAIGICGLIMNIGIVLFSMAVLFYLVTLPVEFNASNRALKILKNTGTLDKKELKGVKKVLGAAAMTYVAAALTALGNLLRLMVVSSSRRNKR